MTDKPLQCYHLTGNSATTLKVGDTVEVNGNIKNYVNNSNQSTIEFENPTLVSCTYAQTTDADKVADAITDIKVVETVFEDTTITLASGSNRHSDVAITWALTSNNATLNGTTLTIAQGAEAYTVTLVATVVCGDATQNVNYSIEVQAKVAVGETTTSNFSIAASTGTSGDKSLTWSDDHFTFTATQGSSSTAIRTSDNDHYRAYKGSTFAIASKNGEGITKIVFTMMLDEKYGNDYSTPLTDSVTTEGVTVEMSDDKVTVTVTVINGTIDLLEIAATAQFRITNIEITYTVA